MTRFTARATTRAFTLLLATLTPALAQWTDRSEYDLVLAVRAETAPRQRLVLLDQWKSRYAASPLAQARLELYFSTYQSLNDAPKTLATARELAASSPANLTGLYWFTLLAPATQNPDAGLLDDTLTAARRLIASLDNLFAPASAWAPNRAKAELIAHRALGWVQWQRKNYADAQTEFAACLKLDPGRAEISSWYALALAQEAKPGSQPAALWHMARAASLSGPGALPEAQRASLASTLERLYTAYRGDAAGLDELRAAVVKSPLPPESFTIESAPALALRRQDEELARTNPPLFAWIQLRRRLEEPAGEAYFAASVRNQPLPTRMKGTLLRATPPDAPTELVLGVGDPAAEEVTLKLDAPLPGPADPGTVVEFEGTVDAFTKSPFSVTVLTSPAKLEGWKRVR